MTLDIVTRVVEDEIEFYTVQATGESGLSLTGLSRLCDVYDTTIGDLVKNLQCGKAPKRLQSLLGKEITLGVTYRYKGRLVKIVRAEICASIIKHYAFEGKEVAEYSLEKFTDIGINTWIHGITGWKAEDTSLKLLHEAEGRLLEQEHLILALQQQTELHADQLASYKERLERVEAEVNQNSNSPRWYGYNGSSYYYPS